MAVPESGSLLDAELDGAVDGCAAALLLAWDKLGIIGPPLECLLCRCLLRLTFVQPESSSALVAAGRIPAAPAAVAVRHPRNWNVQAGPGCGRNYRQTR